jgi:mRNA interferase RelE/StbE
VSFKVEIHQKAEKELKALPERDQNRILDKLFVLTDDPFPREAVKLKGHTGYRLRAGDYRILYEVDKNPV